jgi:hypothetical protein
MLTRILYRTYLREFYTRNISYYEIYKNLHKEYLQELCTMDISYYEYL